MVDPGPSGRPPPTSRTGRPRDARGGRCCGQAVEEPGPGRRGRRARGNWEHCPFVTGFLLAAGALLAYWFGGLILQAGSVLILIVVSLFIAFGLNPVGRWLVNHGIRRSWAVLVVALGVVAALALFVVAIAPVVADQISALTDNAPGWFD